MKHWEKLATVDKPRGDYNTLDRWKVQGGWLYRTTVAYRDGLSVAMEFVPDTPPVDPDERDRAREWHKAQQQRNADYRAWKANAPPEVTG